MKKLIIVAIALFTLNVATAKNPTNPVKEKPTKSLRADIIQLLGSKTSFEFEKSEMVIDVIFTITSENKIIVLSTSAENKQVSDFIKSKLNYHEVSLKNHKVGKLFLLPVKFKK